MNSAIQTFLLSLPALLSIVNPIGGVMMFSQMTAGLPIPERRYLARRVGIYSAVVLLVALWIGSHLLQFFGVSLSALRIAGGLVVLSSAWTLLQAPDGQEGRDKAKPDRPQTDTAFFPLTMPLTTGPGAISVAIALASNTPTESSARLFAISGASAAALVVALSIYGAYSLADRISAVLGPSLANVISRLASFVLLCIGTQIMLVGVADFVQGLHG